MKKQIFNFVLGMLLFPVLSYVVQSLFIIFNGDISTSLSDGSEFLFSAFLAGAYVIFYKEDTSEDLIGNQNKVEIFASLSSLLLGAIAFFSYVKFTDLINDANNNLFFTIADITSKIALTINDIFNVVLGLMVFGFVVSFLGFIACKFSLKLPKIQPSFKYWLFLKLLTKEDLQELLKIKKKQETE